MGAIPRRIALHCGYGECLAARISYVVEDADDSSHDCRYPHDAMAKAVSIVDSLGCPRTGRGLCRRGNVPAVEHAAFSRLSRLNERPNKGRFLSVAQMPA